MRCPHCGRDTVIFDSDSNTYVCQVCGAVVDERPAYQGTEGFPKNNTTPRNSGALTHRVHDHGVGGTEIAGSFKAHLRRGRSWVRANSEIKVDKRDRKLKKALQWLNEYLKLLDPPTPVRETAALLVREAVKDKNFKENTVRKIIVAAIYLSYKINKQPRSAKVFCSELNIEDGYLWEGIRLIREAVKDVKLTHEHYDPRYYIGFITHRLNAPPVVETLANSIASSAESYGFLSGKNPASLAAASVYLAGIISNNKRNQLEVAETIGLTDVAIRNAYDSILRNLDIDVLL
ncbi:transcription initiation factor IIB [Desulfurococcus mucosus]|uniref:Transcription factor TFIIB cyclin-related protein n=1 Tax=Desulfurococcus mucosus (strain ATCC 35584 / DSM 2162 / JCM 9187 / O7/1) TaxID=765177 RepID=E8R712_DESM0|nr:transcription initiation factor IIB family protein [Desulfurococcus mucosus]ADV64445.1 Transcription factor TFIIB cyclin-related protein [Desulfurococcus mucosus DSM 2162]